MSRTIEEVRKVKNEVKESLLKKPGVTGVNVGYKKISGKKTDILAIIVYVKEKKKMEKNLIPAEIMGIPTDVVERKFVLH